MSSQNIVYPRRLWIRRPLQQLSKAAFWLLSDFQVEGEENLPEGGPLLVIGNHFSFIDQHRCATRLVGTTCAVPRGRRHLDCDRASGQIWVGHYSLSPIR